jgi:hypothetical protein
VILGRRAGFIPSLMIKNTIIDEKDTFFHEKAQLPPRPLIRRDGPPNPGHLSKPSFPGTL